MSGRFLRPHPLSIIPQVRLGVNPILGKIKIKIFFKKPLTKTAGCGIMVNSARGVPPRAAQQIQKKDPIGVLINQYQGVVAIIGCEPLLHSPRTFRHDFSGFHVNQLHNARICKFHSKLHIFHFLSMVLL